jgi:hypothetical protein
MNEPVRVGLVFPRSGQKLYVNVPRQSAATLDTVCAGLQSQGVVSLRLGSDRPTDVTEHLPRTQ